MSEILKKEDWSKARQNGKVSIEKAIYKNNNNPQNIVIHRVEKLNNDVCPGVEDGS